jgi:hypothetical protein
MATLYHIKCSQSIAIAKVRGLCDHHLIENYICDGGIHLHLTPNKIRIAKDIAETVNSELEAGLLPSATGFVNNLMCRVVRLYSQNLNLN